MMPQPVVVVQRLASYGELAVAVLLGLLFGLWLGLVLSGPDKAEAGEVQVTWQQPDCADVDRWDLLGLPLPHPGATPLPTLASVVATIPKQAQHCQGASATATVTISALGPARFWLRAVKTTPPVLTSGVSNSADASVPLGKPSGLSVATP